MSLDLSARLADTLRSVDLPGAEDARARGISAVAVALAAAPAPTRPRRLVLVSLALVLIVAALALTPPGRAVAEWAADLVGIGEVGGPSSVEEPVSGIEPSSERIILATGRTPSGEPFELVVYRADQPHFERVKVPSATCVQTVFPERHERFDGGGAGTCNYGPYDSDLGVLSMGFPGADYPGGTYAHGEASAEVRTVDLSYVTDAGERRRSEATVAAVAGADAERLGIADERAYWTAFFPGLSRRGFDEGHGFEMVARGAAGEVVARDTFVPPRRR